MIHAAGGENLQAMSTYPEHEVFDTRDRDVVDGAGPADEAARLAGAVVGGDFYVIGGGRAAMLSTSDIVEVFTPEP